MSAFFWIYSLRLGIHNCHWTTATNCGCDMSTQLLPSRFCWQRLRLVLSWLLWLSALLLIRNDGVGSLFIIFAFLAGCTAPRQKLEPGRIGRPVSALIVLQSVLCVILYLASIPIIDPSPRAIAFLISPMGVAVKIVIWVGAVVLPEWRIYRQLPPFRTSAYDQVTPAFEV